MGYLKAIVGALIAGLGALSTALPDGVDGQEWITVALATLAGLGFVYAVPNRPAPSS